jgi:peptide/nickel transport system substrate-binding protein
MKGKAVWLLLSCLATTALIISSCGTPAATTTAQPTTIAPTTSKPPTTPPTTTAASDKPKYGGILTLAQASDVTVFDPAISGQLMSAGGPGGNLVYEQMAVQDWSKGAFGSKQYGLSGWVSSAYDTYSGGLAESWTTPGPGVYVFKVRQGVKWALDPNNAASVLMNARQMTADDWVSNWDVLANNPKGGLSVQEPVVAKSTTVKKTGPWEVTITHTANFINAWLWVETGGGCYLLLPPEVIKKYGNVADWRNIVGTGPFMISDFVPNSAITYKRNPNYWGTDPVGPGKGNQLPYADGIKYLIIPDISTRVAALRTGKIDMLGPMETNDAKSVKQTVPGINSAGYYNSQPYVVAMRTDKPNLPFKDKRVRQALMYATDFNAMANQLYGGDAKLFTYPVDGDMLPDLFVPLDKLPEACQDLYKYNPDKAKKLLADAGYPNGFKTSIVVNSVAPVGSDVDVASVYKAMWAKVGVDLTLDVKEPGVWNSIEYSRAYDEMFLRWEWTFWSAQFMMTHWQGVNFDNGSYVNTPPGTDPIIEEAYKNVQANTFVDWTKANKAIRDLTPYVVEQAFYIPRPSPQFYNFWQPWIKNIDGNLSALFMKYHWIDQVLKQSMGK